MNKNTDYALMERKISELINLSFSLYKKQLFEGLDI